MPDWPLYFLPGIWLFCSQQHVTASVELPKNPCKHALTHSPTASLGIQHAQNVLFTYLQAGQKQWQPYSNYIKITVSWYCYVEFSGDLPSCLWFVIYRFPLTYTVWHSTFWGSSLQIFYFFQTLDFFTPCSRICNVCLSCPSLVVLVCLWLILDESESDLLVR